MLIKIRFLVFDGASKRHNIRIELNSLQAGRLGGGGGGWWWGGAYIRAGLIRYSLRQFMTVWFAFSHLGGGIFSSWAVVDKGVAAILREIPN